MADALATAAAMELQNKFQASLKGLIFEFMFTLLKEDETSAYFTIILCFIQYCQIFYFAFHPAVVSVWGKVSIPDNLQLIFGSMNLTEIYNRQNFSLFVVLFYFGAIIIFIFTIGFTFMINSIKKQKAVTNTVKTNLRLTINFLLTLLFMPLFYMFLSMLKCKDSALQFHPEVKCYQGMHLFHFFIGIIFAILIATFTIIFSLLYFDGMYNEEKVISKKNNRQTLSLVLYEIFLSLFYVFFGDESFKPLLIAIYCLGGIITFYMNHTIAPFNNPIISKCQSLLASTNMWTSIMLLLAYLSEGKIFNGIIYAWLLGLPLMFGVVIWSPLKSSQTVGVMNVNKFDSALSVIEHTNYVQRLVIYDINKSINGQLLNGYIEFHNKTCLLVNCPLKKVKFNSKNDKTQGKKSVSKRFKDKRYLHTYEMIQQLFELGIVKFPTVIALRIYYAVFLSEILKSKQHALGEILDAEKFKSTIDEDFTLFQIKRIVETNINDIQNDGQDYAEQLMLDSNLNSFKNSIELTTSQLMEFWLQLTEDKPDLIKLYEISSKLLPLKELVDVMWKKIQISTPDKLINLIRLYSRYQSDILNDKRLGTGMMDKAQKLEEQLKLLQDKNLKISSETIIDGIEDPIVFITMDEQRLGQVISLNQSSLFLTGFSKGELYGKSVNTIIPNFLLPYHDDLLKQQLETEKLNLAGRITQLWVKSKQNYIIPVHVDLRCVFHSLSDSMEFFARLIKDKSLRNVAIVIASRDGIVKDINQSCIQLLGLETRHIQQFEIKLEQLIPDYSENFQEFMSIQGAQIEYQFPKISEERVEYGKGKEKLILKINITDFEIHLGGVKSIGYVLRAELVQKKGQKKKTKKNNFYSQNDSSKIGINMNNSFSVNGVNTSALQGNSLIQPQQKIFRFVLTVYDQELVFNGDVIDGERYDQMELLDASNQLDSNLQNIMISFQQGQSVFLQTTKRDEKKNFDLDVIVEKKQDSVQQKEWGEGIKIVRYMNGQFQEVDKEDSQVDSEEERERLEEMKSQEAKNRYGENQQDLWNIQTAGQILSKDLNQLLIRKEESLSVKLIRIFTGVLFLVIIATTLTDYLLKQKEIEGQKQDLRQIIISSQQISQMQTIMSSIRELVLLSRGVRIPQYTTITGNSPTILTDEIKLKEILQSATDEFQNLTIQMGKNQKLKSQDVDVYFSLDKYQVFDYDYSTRQMTSRSYTIKDMILSEIVSENQDVFFVSFNGLNKFCNVLFQRYQEVNDLTVGNLLNLDNLSATFLWASLVFMSVICLILVVMLFKSIIDKRKLMQIFLDIPERTAKQMNQKCILFLASLVAGEDEELISETDLILDQEKEKEGEGAASLTGVKRKKFKNINFGISSQVFKSLAVFILVEAYFIINYSIGKQQIFDMRETLREYNYTTIAEAYYSFVLNSQLALALDDKWTILGNEPIAFMPQMIQEMYRIDSTVHEEHAKNTKQHQNDVGYLAQFDQIMFQNPCDILVEQKAVSILECKEFANQIVQQGMITVVVRYFQLLRYTRDRMEWIVKNKDQDFDFASIGVTPGNFSTQKYMNNILNIVRLAEIYEMIEIQIKYQKYSFRYLQGIFTEEMVLIFDQYMVQRVLFMVIFLTIISFSFIMCWIPLINQMDKEIWSQKSLLTFIPVEDMARISNISNFIRDYILPGRI